MSQGAGRAGIPSVPPRGCRPSLGMPSELPDGQDVRNGVRVPGPRGGMPALLAPLQKRAPPGLPAPGAGPPMVCPWRQGGEAAPVLLSILAAIPTAGFS